jgi:autotransporter-associated beta strand protein
LVSDSQQGGIARVDSLSLTLTGSLAESGEAVFRPGDTVSGGGVVSGQVNLTSTSPNASVAANIGEADSLHFGGGMVGTANLVKHGRGELVIGRPNGGGGAGARGVASNNDYSGEIEVSEGSLKLVGNNALGSGARINLGGGGVELRLAEDTAVSNAITLAAASTLSKVQVSSGGASISSDMQGAGGFEKSGAGTLTIGGINTYEGVTHVSSGTLKVSGEITQSDVTVTGNARLSLTSSGNLGGDVVVQEGAALGGLGTFSGNVTVQGLHSPGNSPGLQTAAAGLTYGSSARLEWELFSNTAEASARGTSYDAIEITGGNLLINTGAVIDLSFSDPAGTPNPSTVSWANAFWSSNQSWQMIKLSGSGAYGTPASQFTIGTIGNDASGVAFATARPGSSFTTSNLTDGVYINYVIPEPSSALLGGLASLLLLRRRR